MVISPQICNAVAATRRDDGEVDGAAMGRLLPLLPTVEDSPDGLRQFAAQATDQPVDSVHLQKLGGEGNKGGSGATLEIIQDGGGHTLGVLKLYPGAGAMDEDLSGLLRLQDPPLAAIHTVRPLAVGRSTVNGRQGAVLVMSDAPGQAEDDLLLSVGKAQGAARDQALARMHDAVRGTAQTLADLHTKTARPTRPDAYLQHWTTEVDNSLAGLAQHADRLAGLGVTLPDLQTAVKRAEAGVEADPGGASLAHGDAHCGNFFWDADHQSVTVIDCSGVHHAEGAQGQPIGMGAHDVAKFYQQLGVDGRRFGLSDAEIGGLQKDFWSSYQAESGVRPTQAALDFFSLGMAVITLGFCMRWCPANPTPDMAALLSSLTRNVQLAESGEGTPKVCPPAA